MAKWPPTPVTPQTTSTGFRDPLVLFFPLFECKNRKAQSAAMDDTSIVMDDHFRSSVKYILLSFVCSVDFLLGDSLME